MAAEWFERVVKREIETACCRRCLIVYYSIMYVSEFAGQRKEKMNGLCHTFA